ncbi:MAG: type VI secretion system contractile sheath small subunit [Pyrinomonadaceae bacterium]
MPKTESTQHKLSRVRAPRVHITYDVEVGNAIEAKELPFVVGVLGDFSGKPDPDDPNPLPKVKERKFIEIDRDNFDKVLAGMKPRLAYSVRNRLTPGGGNINVELRFDSLDDFEPDKVVQNVEPLKELVEKRQRLSDLLSKMDGNDRLESLLSSIINDGGARSELSRNLGIEGGAATNGGGKKEGEE